MARYGEDQAHSFKPRLYPYGYRYRDWVVKALNDDMPYDRFVMEQIAGDLLDGPGRDERLAALGFFALGPVYYGNAVDDELDDRIDTLCRGFLGLTVACARCHDHKFDPIPTPGLLRPGRHLLQHRVQGVSVGHRPRRSPRSRRPRPPSRRRPPRWPPA